jgi:hypothetical protein
MLPPFISAGFPLTVSLDPLSLGWGNIFPATKPSSKLTLNNNFLPDHPERLSKSKL